MRSWLPVLGLLAACGFDDTFVGGAEPRDPGADWEPFPVPNVPFPPGDDPLLGYRIPADELREAESRGSGLAVVGERIYVADRSGSRVVVMNAGDLTVRNSIAVGAGPVQLVADRFGAIYVTVERANEVVRIEPGDTVVSRHIALDGGPWGIALDQTGDVWVSLAGAGALVRLDARLMKVHERFELGGAPRSVSVDGANRVAVVLQSGRMHLIDRRLDSVGRMVDLVDGDRTGTHTFGIAADPRGDRFFVALGLASPADGLRNDPIRTRLTTVRVQSIARTYDDAWIDQPAELVHHPTLSLAFIASTGEGTITLLDTRDGVRPLRTFDAGKSPRALALSSSGSRLFVLLEGSLAVRSFDLEDFELVARKTRSYGASSLPLDARLGRDLFYASAWNQGVRVACASCHIHGGGDGIVWSTDTGARRTPVLAGRLEGTSPYGWGGRHATLRDLLRAHIADLGGDPESVGALLGPLETYIAHHLPAPARPAFDRQRGRRARGEAIFGSAEAGCASCHAGATFSDDLLWDVGTSAEPLNTPSLIDVFASAPYFHDGSAPTLPDVLARHAPPLTPSDREALVAYLRSL